MHASEYRQGFFGFYCAKDLNLGLRLAFFKKVACGDLPEGEQSFTVSSHV